MAQQAGQSGRAAEVFPPGDFIREELEARGWSQQEFAEILGRPIQTVNQIVNAKKEITPETALAIAAAFGTSAEVWLNLESTYRLSLAGAPDSDVGRRARLRGLVPVRELQKRAWIGQTRTLDELEGEVCAFLEIGSLDEKPKLPVAARRSDGYGDLSASQTAWVFRAKHVAAALDAPGFSKRKLQATLPTLPRLSVNEAGMAQVVPMLAAAGVRVVFVPHIKGSRTDGAAFWLNARSPVVALSFRYDRIDWFWFTLMHELAHVLQGHAVGGRIDMDLVGRSPAPTAKKPKDEREADRLASDWLIPPKPLAAFVRETRPYFSARKVAAFAAEVGVHPGIVVGRLQHIGEIPYRNLRRLLVKARAQTDSRPAPATGLQTNAANFRPRGR